ncbi:hypothetical protein DXG03_005510 [Asterophora parasitica]|uniref:SMP-30/Gluconolactonase/LRE-like region domain-containing protein n=1 Tax=Asterophora parasitica TaxID=117018 RepID=A0A9P7GES1_9AGAR|nr:hypothetical protein DXG03_005510 [Asterophora parasitica]
MADSNKDTGDNVHKPKSPPPSNLTRNMVIASVFLTFLAYAAAVFTGEEASKTPRDASLDLPPQSVFIDPKSFAVLGGTDKGFRESSFKSFFNPTSTAPPFFQVFDRRFLSILGPNASIREVAFNTTFAFAHEAPIYVSATDEVFFGSNDGGPLGLSDLDNNNVIGKISLKDVDAAIAANDSAINVPVTILDLPDTVQMTNGGTGPYRSSLLLITSGRGPRPPSIALVNPQAPHNVTVLLDNFFGRQFNSLNDIKVHPSGNLFFTDVVYGYLNHFRPEPLLPSQVYRFDPKTGTVRVVATDFDKPNGIAFSIDGEIAYIYAFDVDTRTHAFTNRRVFAYIDAGVPDGLQVDLTGNVYSGCGDGVHVWDDKGTLLGKFFLGTVSANMVFAQPGRLVILAETKIFVADIAAAGLPSISP